MLPLQDNIPTRSIPIVNYSMIAACAIVFLVQLRDRPGEVSLIERLGMIPLRIIQPEAAITIQDVGAEELAPGRYQEVMIEREAAPSMVPPVFTLLTCIFLHGGWMHFLGNMWFLFIFGDNVEDRFGHVGYLIFYLASGAGASLTHLVTDPSSGIPTIGASGAIAGVLGAYFLWYPGAQVKALIPLGVLTRVAVLPAPLFLGVWFVMQLAPGLMSLGSSAGSGVAWWAHIGGFLIGLMLAFGAGQLRLAAPPNAIRDDFGEFHRPFRRRLGRPGLF